MEIVNSMLNEIDLPKFISVEQYFKADKLDDINMEIDSGFSKAIISERISKNTRIGITVGSRGIANLSIIVKRVCENIKLLGAEPIIIPSMGSHGGAVAEGQVEIVNGLGITEESVGAKIVASMDVVKLGNTENGIPVYYDKEAYNLDGVIVLNRVKAHTDISGDIESGLQKMICIGLGNHKGALTTHIEGMQDASNRIKEIGGFVLQNSNIIFGMAILENAYDETNEIAFIPNEEIQIEEPKLLLKSKAMLPKIYLNNLDALIVDYIGKDISGDGMDPNIIGRSTIGYKNRDVNISNIVTLNLTKKTHTNAMGVGLSDITTRKIFNQLEFDQMYANAITAIAINGVKIPIVMDNDKKALQLAAKISCKKPDEIRAVRIKDTLNLKEIMISEALLKEAKNMSEITIKGELEYFQFDNNDNLITNFE